MDLGCIDMGCIEKPKKENSLEKENSPKETVTSASRLGKTSRAKDAMRSSLNALTKLTSQITKPPHRKTSPVNWFPRNKVEPYLKRKIKMLQEVHGMQSTLDETLGDSHPHYSKVLREKIAIKEAADKAIEARKTAMVEASWCHILHAARIETKEAETRLEEAEKHAAEALEAAREVGVTLKDIPDCVSMTSHISSTFDIDKQVAHAVKAALIKFANSASINKDEFKELLHKISEHPDTDENHHEQSDFTSESECDGVLESETENCDEQASVARQKKSKNRRDSDKFSMSNMIEMMLDRLGCLKEDELVSLAAIVATCGLNAALAQSRNKKHYDDPKSVCERFEPSHPCTKASNRMSIGGTKARRSCFDAQERTGEAELPSLDKFLVKKLTRLEREVLEAKNARKNEGNICKEEKPPLPVANTCSRNEEVLKVDDGTKVADHGKDFEEVRAAIDELYERNDKKAQTGNNVAKQDVTNLEVPSLDKFLVKRLTRLEREVQEARNNKNLESTDERRRTVDSVSSTDKENVDLNRIGVQNRQSKKLEEANYESLDKVLVKHMSRLEREKLEFCAGEETGTKLKRKDCNRDMDRSEGGLDQVLVKHKSRLEKEKMAAAASDDGQGNGSINYSLSRRQAREREMHEAWGGLGLGHMRPHVSRLEKDKAAWIKAEEEERKRGKEVGV